MESGRTIAPELAPLAISMLPHKGSTPCVMPLENVASEEETSGSQTRLSSSALIGSLDAVQALVFTSKGPGLEKSS